jgi:hypothetical protein
MDDNEYARALGMAMDPHASDDQVRRATERALVQAAVMRAITCPYTGRVLDMRRAVLVSTSQGASFVCEAAHWDAMKPHLEAGIRAAIADGRAPEGYRVTEVLDGRELWAK